jgi:uncharacterized membrane protein YebE (DUF533 family)
VPDLWTDLLGCLDLSPQRPLPDEQSGAHDIHDQVTVRHQGHFFATSIVAARQARGVLQRKENRSHIAQNLRFRELDSRNRRIITSENGFDVDTRRWLMTELPQVLGASNYAVTARGEAL